METNQQQQELQHHTQQTLCTSRPLYRQGKKLTAVRVYTISSESKHLFVYNVPKVNLRPELKALFQKYGKINKICVATNTANEEFTECFHIEFERIQSAKIAKKLLDNRAFYGSLLHICYAPEAETVETTRRKLIQRQQDTLTRSAHFENYKKNDELEALEAKPSSRKRKHHEVDGE